MQLSPAYPVTVSWSEYSESCPDRAALCERLVLLWQTRAGLPVLQDASGVVLDARVWTQEALCGHYGGEQAWFRL